MSILVILTLTASSCKPCHTIAGVLVWKILASSIIKAGTVVTMIYSYK